MSSSIFRRNDATTVNPNVVNGKPVDIAITVRGSDFYFAICAVMGLVSLGVMGLSYLKPRKDRIFFYITAAINGTAFIAYFTMGSNLGWTPIDVEWLRSDPVVAGINREIFYVRYIDWFVTTPLLLMDLLLTAALPWPTIIWVIFLDEVMIITGLIGALVKSRYKFGFYTIGCIAMFGIFYELAIVGRAHAKALGQDVHRVFLACGVLTLFLWTLYPVAWGLAEGGNVIAPDSEAIFYGILDFCAKPVFSIMLIAGHWNIEPERLGLSIRDYPYVKEEERQNNEKNHSKNHTGSDETGSDNTPTHNAVPHTVRSPPAVNNPPVARSSPAQNLPHDHASHTTGLAPFHEGTTTETGSHVVTARHAHDLDV